MGATSVRRGWIPYVEQAIASSFSESRWNSGPSTMLNEFAAKLNLRIRYDAHKQIHTLTKTLAKPTS